MPAGIALEEIELRAVRSQGAGGQNVNKVSSAVHLRFDIQASASLSAEHKARLLALKDRRINAEGVVVIKAQQFRSQDQNRHEALRRLAHLIDSVSLPPRCRRATRPTLASRRRRLEDKRQRSQIKSARGRLAA